MKKEKKKGFLFKENPSFFMQKTGRTHRINFEKI